MPGSIKIDCDAVKTAVAELQALSSNTALDDALQALLSVVLSQSSGDTATTAKAFGGGFSAVNSSLKRLFTLTIETLRNAEEYFSMTDAELAAFIASNDGRG